MTAHTYVDRLNQACNYVRNKINDRPDVGIILGSGLGSYGDELVDAIKIPYKEIPQMLDTTVPGHSGCLIYGKVGERKVLCLSGRSHQYEGLHPHEVQFAIRLLAMCGSRLVILTNAAGTRNPDLNVGDLAPMHDHMNFTHRGYTEEPLIYKEFNHIIQTDMYDKEALSVAHQVAVEKQLSTTPCVYVYNFGPTYETHAEVEGEYALGGTNFGMSTVPEVISMKELQVPVLAMSFVTNKAAGVTDVPLSHEEVARAAKAGEPNMKALISEVIKRTALKDFPIPAIEGDDRIMARPRPETFVSDEDVDSIAKLFGNTKIDAGIILCGCHTLEGFDAQTTVNGIDLPKLPFLQHTTLKLQIGILSGKQVAVVSGLRDLCGLEVHALHYFAGLFKKLGASTFIQTFSAGKLEGAENGISIVKDVIPFFEYPVIVPVECKRPFDVELVGELPKSVLASYHGPEFPSASEAIGYQRSKATHITLGTVRGLLIAKGHELRTLGIVDGAYNGVLTSNDTTEAVLASCRASSSNVTKTIVDALGKIENSAPHGSSFTPSSEKGLGWNDVPSAPQNEQEDPEVVAAIQAKLPEIQFAIIFQKECPQYDSIKAKLTSVVDAEGNTINYGTLNGKQVGTCISTLPLVRALAAKDVLIIAFSNVIPLTPELKEQKYVSIIDHTSLTGIYPLVGHNRFGTRFPDMGHMYQIIEGVPKATSFNSIDLRETTDAYSEMMRLMQANVSTTFGPKECIVTRHSGGRFVHIGAVVNCPRCVWEIDDEILTKLIK